MQTSDIGTSKVYISPCVGWIGEKQDSCYHIYKITLPTGDVSTNKVSAFVILDRLSEYITHKQARDLWAHMRSRNSFGGNRYKGREMDEKSE